MYGEVYTYQGYRGGIYREERRRATYPGRSPFGIKRENTPHGRLLLGIKQGENPMGGLL